MSPIQPEGWEPFTADEFRRFAPKQLQPDYPPITSVEYPEPRVFRSGGFGVVYRAFDTRLKRIVAVKVAHRRTGETAEALILARFQHPNIVTVHGTGLTEDGRPFIVTEWLDGGSLADRLKARQTLTYRQWAALFEMIARALDNANVAGYLHRDIKPSNILFAKAEPGCFSAPKLADFGLAVRGTTGPDGSGTDGYKAPELCEGKPSRFSDIFSLGVTLWQCLTGNDPPVDKPLPYPLRLQGIPATLAAIVNKCLAPKPLERYSRENLNIDDLNQRPALGLAEDLRAFLDHRPTRARLLNPVQRMGLWVWRSPWQAGTFAMLGVGLTVSTAFAWQLARSLGREQNERQRADKVNQEKLAETEEKLQAIREKLQAERQANLQRYARQLRQVQEYLRNADSNAAVAELKRLKRWDSALCGWEWDYLMGQCDGALNKVNFASPVQAISVGTNDHLAVAVYGGKVYLGPWGKGLADASPLPEDKHRVIRRMWFMPDRLLTASTVHSDAVIVGVLNAHALARQSPFEPVRELFLFGEFSGDSPAIPALTPDRGGVVFPGKLGTLKVLDLTAGSVRTLAEKLPSLTALAFQPDGSVLAAAIENEVRFWAWPTMELLSILRPQRGKLRTLAFGADGTLTLVAQVRKDKEWDISLWRHGDGWELSEYRGVQQHDIRQLVCSSVRGGPFVTVGQTLTVWLPGEGGLRCRDLLGHTAPLSAVAFSPDGQRIFSGDVAGEVREYNALLGQDLGVAFGSVVRAPGVTARIDAGQVKLNGQSLPLDDLKPSGLAFYPPDKATRLLVSDNHRHVAVVDVETRESILHP
jgi:WD40 repeat protein